MNKAFTKEEDALPDDVDEFVDTLPAGEQNYITPHGLDAFRERLEQEGQHLEKLRGESLEPTAQALNEMRVLERRIARLASRMATFVVIQPVAGAEQVQFGARVLVRDDEGAERRYEIVGIDETDIEQHRLSWVSPLARALLGAKRGESVAFTSPRGEQTLEILEID